MKALTIVLTDEQAERVDEAERRLGITTRELVCLALDAFLEITNGFRAAAEAVEFTVADVPEQTLKPPRLGFAGLGRSGRSEIAANMEQILTAESDELEDGHDPSSKSGKPGNLQWLIGLGQHDHTFTAVEAERIRADEYLRFIWDDSFGGERSVAELYANLPPVIPTDDDESMPP